MPKGDKKAKQGSQEVAKKMERELTVRQSKEYQELAKETEQVREGTDYVMALPILLLGSAHS